MPRKGPAPKRKIVPDANFRLRSASLVQVSGKEAVLVLVEDEGTEMLRNRVLDSIADIRIAASDGSLLFLCDRTDCWSLYRWRSTGEVETVVDVGSDIAVDDRFDLVIASRRAATGELLISLQGEAEPLPLPHGIAVDAAVKPQGSSLRVHDGTGTIRAGRRSR